MASVAISAGVGLATRFLLSALTPEKERPEVNTDAPKSSYGNPISKPYGKTRFKGATLIWSPELSVEEESSGGGKGGGGGGSEERIVRGTWASLVCEGEIESIEQIFFSGEVVYNPNSDDADTREESQDFADNHLEIFLGTNTQSPSSTIQSVEGVDRTPAFRNYSYLVFRDVELGDYGNRIPRIDVIVKERTTQLADVIKDVCQRANIPLSQVDTSEINQTIQGAQYDQTSSPRDFLEELQKAYSLLSAEIDGVIKFFPQKRSNTLKTIPQPELASTEADGEIKSRFTEKRTNELELPSEVQVEYKNVDDNLQPGFSYTPKPSATHVNEVNFKNNLTLSDSEAKTIASRILSQAYLHRREFEDIGLLVKHIDIQPGDVIEIPVRGINQPIQVESLDIGANYLLQLKGITYSGATLDIQETVETEYNPRLEIKSPGEAKALILDIPLIRDNDEDLGVYTAVDAPKPEWNQGRLFISDNDGASFTKANTLSQQSVVGTVAEALPERSPHLIDEVSKLTLTVESGKSAEISSVPESDFLKGRFCALVGNELVAIQNANLIADNTYELSRFIRGYRGTEYAISTHSTDERFVLLRGGYSERVPGSLEYIDDRLTFKAVHKGQTVTGVGTSTNQIIEGNSSKPYSPAHVEGERDNNGNLTISWIRRVRKKGAWRDRVDVPSIEANELYQVDILDNGTVVRTLTTSSPTVQYSASQQTEDFGSVQNSVNLQIFQLSESVGRGFGVEKTL
jgi:hypothetical protein